MDYKKKYEHLKGLARKHAPKASGMKQPGEAAIVGIILERVEVGFANSQQLVKDHPYAKPLIVAAIGYKVAKKRPAAGFAMVGVAGYMASATYRAQNPDGEAKGVGSRQDAGNFNPDAGNASDQVFAG